MDKVTFGYKLVTASEKRKLVDDQFNAIARTYDLADNLLSLGLHFLWKRTTIRMLSLKQGELCARLMRRHGRSGAPRGKGRSGKRER